MNPPRGFAHDLVEQILEGADAREDVVRPSQPGPPRDTMPTIAPVASSIAGPLEAPLRQPAPSAPSSAERGIDQAFAMAGAEPDTAWFRRRGRRG